MLGEIAPLHVRRDVFIPPIFFPRAVSVIGPGVGVGVGVEVGVPVGVGVGVAIPLVTAARISTRPQPKMLFGGPAVPHWVEAILTAALFKAARLGSIWFCKLGIADQSRAMAPAICGVAMEVPLAIVYALSELLEADRVFVPGAVISGFIRPLPSIVAGPRLLKEAIVSLLVFSAPTV